MKLKIHKWNIQSHLMRKPDSIILLLGKRGTGKSHMMRAIAQVMAQNGNIDMAIGMSPTDESNETLSSFLPKTLIYSDFDENVIVKLMQNQRRQIKRGRKPKRIFLFLDDCGYDSKKIFNSKTMKNLFYNGRHYNIGLCLALQFCIDMPTAFRANCDVAITLREQIQSNRERLWKQYFGQFETIKAFNLAMNACTENYSALVTANNLTQSNQLSDSIFWYRANEHIPSFKLGNSIVFRLNDHCFEDQEEIIEKERKMKELEIKRNEEIHHIIKGDEDGRSILN